MSKNKPVISIEENSDEYIENGKEEEEEFINELMLTSDDDENKTTFPDLFSETKTGKTMLWRIWVIDDLVYQTNGFVDGKMKEPKPRRIERLKRKNAPSAEEQARIYAERCWVKQLDKGYQPDSKDKSAMEKYERILKEKALQGGNNTGLSLSNKKAPPKSATVKKNSNKPTPLTVAQVLKEYTPMKAEKLSERKKFFITDKNVKKDIIENVMKKRKLSFDECVKMFMKDYFDATEGFFVQPKLDGWRCIIRLQVKEGKEESDDINNYDVVMTTQNNKQYPWFEHIKKEFIKFIGDNLDTILDCEVYAHKIVIDGKEVSDDDRFTIIGKACSLSRKEPYEHEKQMQIHVFDIVDDSLTQEERFKILSKLFKKYKGNIIQRVATYEAYSLDDVYNFHDEFAQDKFEGVMLRAKYMLYSENRVAHLLKYKSFLDKECSVVGATKSEGTEEGCIIWICKWDNDKTFTCRQRGTVETRRELYNKYYKKYGSKLEKPVNNLGYLTIRYQQLTNDGLPRFPVGVGILRQDMDFS